jgi:hypothetical protein
MINQFFLKKKEIIINFMKGPYNEFKILLLYQTKNNYFNNII